MLVLSRKLNEEIHIGNNITITVLQVKGRVIRLGIEAPRDIRIIRGELSDHDVDSKSSQSLPMTEQHQEKPYEEDHLKDTCLNLRHHNDFHEPSPVCSPETEHSLKLIMTRRRRERLAKRLAC